MMVRIVLIMLLLIGTSMANYKDITIQKFADIVSKITGKNVVIDEDISQKVNISISSEIDQNVSFDMLEAILSKKGLYLEQHDGFYIIKKKVLDNLHLYRLHHIDSSEISSNVASILSSIKKPPSIGFPVTEKSESSMPKPKNQTKTAGFELKTLTDDVLALVYTDPMYKRTLETIIKEVDIEPKRIKVTSRIYEINTEDLRELGSNFGIFGKILETSGAFGTNIIANFNTLGLPETKFTKNNQFILSGLINFLDSNSSATFLSSPEVSILEEKKARYHDGSTFPIASNKTVTQSNYTQETTTYQYVDVGTIFEVGFEDFKGENIYLDVNLDIKNVVSYENDQIITTTRKIKTFLTLKNGETVALASLNRENVKEVVYGVPVLKEIPVIKYLFSNSAYEKKNTTLLMFVQAQFI